MCLGHAGRPSTCGTSRAAPATTPGASTYCTQKPGELVAGVVSHRLVAVGLLLALLTGARAGEQLRLANGTTLEVILNSRGDFLGIGKVSIDGVPVSAGGSPMRPRIVGNGRGYERMRVDSIDDGARCAVVCKMVEKTGAACDELRLVIRPEEVAIGRKWYVGFSYQYVLRSDHASARQIIDYTHWELGGRSDGLYLVPPHRITTGEPLSVRRETEFLRSPPFYFQGGAAGTLLIAYDFDEAAPLVYTQMDKPAGTGPISFSDEVHVVPGSEVRTPWRSVLLCRQEDLEGLAYEDEYTRCYEHVTAKLRGHFGIPADGPRRLCVRAAEGLSPGGATPTYAHIRAMLREARNLGFERVSTGCIWSNLGADKCPPEPDLAITGMGITPYGGGEEGLRALCDAADELDMKVYAWAPSGQLVTQSDLWHSNPEWFARRRDGTRCSYGGGPLTWTDLNSGYYDYAMTGFEAARDAGVAGLWLDSFSAVASVVNCADPVRPRFNIVPAFKRMKALADMGYESIYIEGAGPAGIDSAARSHLDEGDHTFYRAASFVYNVRPTEANFYFRMLANYCTPIVALHYALPTYRGNALADHPGQVTRVKYANEAFQKTRGLMAKRTLLRNGDDVWTCVGTRWDSADDTTKVYWPYTDMRVQLGARERACEVLTGEQVEMASGGALFRGEHVYVVTPVEEEQ